MRRLLSTGLSFLWITILILIIDRYAKILAYQYLVLSEPFEILPVFNLTLAFNKGAAFSFLHSQPGWQHFLLGGLALFVSMVILVWLFRLKSKDRWVSIALCFILGGALGNVWDRVLYGQVVDFFDFHLGDWHFAIFNTADSAISIGAFMLILSWFMDSRKDN